jgi:hypothetical protein
MIPAGVCRWQAQYLGSQGDPSPSPGLSSSCHAGAGLAPTPLPFPQRTPLQSLAPAPIYLSCIAQWPDPSDLQPMQVVQYKKAKKGKDIPVTPEDRNSTNLRNAVVLNKLKLTALYNVTLSSKSFKFSLVQVFINQFLN